MADLENTTHDFSVGHGKVILLGEHAVVYGRHALAVPVRLAVKANITDSDDGIHIYIPSWGTQVQLQQSPDNPHPMEETVTLILEQLGLMDQQMKIEVNANVNRAAGMGSSAALAVGIVRALNQHYQLNLNDHRVNTLAFECEKLAHGNPSGIDNTVATYGYPILFKKGKKNEPALIEKLTLGAPLPLVVGYSGVESLTLKMVARVAAARKKNPAIYQQIFDFIDSITLQGRDALQTGDWQQLGELMNVCQGLLNALQVSCWEIEEMIQVARQNGALGAKVTGGGGGGAFIALCPGNQQTVIEALNEAGYQAMEVTVNG